MIKILMPYSRSWEGRLADTLDFLHIDNHEVGLLILDREEGPSNVSCFRVQPSGLLVDPEKLTQWLHESNVIIVLNGGTTPQTVALMCLVLRENIPAWDIQRDQAIQLLPPYGKD